MCWVAKLQDNEIDTVETLTHLKADALERWGIPGAIAAILAEQASLCAGTP